MLASKLKGPSVDYSRPVYMLSVLFFISFSFLARRRNFFCLNHVTKVRKKIFSFKVELSGNIVLNFLTETSASCKTINTINKSN